ncbi:MAG: UvrD-helicase domain-containing protein [Proteobacteria bacterium]|nr:UvrD-helicase domain-containing protein [Pseudomonadota bacterium]
MADYIADATRIQHQATDPQKSVWVSANAGTGKTRVLTNRVLRLLVEGGNSREILALTYTRAAAAEMRGRVYKEARAWPAMEEGDLTASLKSIGIDTPSDKHRRRARTLFAHIVDAASSLRIGTIHSFCQSVLKRFPFEAKVNPYFHVIEETQANALKQQALQGVMQNATPAITQSLNHLALVDNETSITELIHQVAKYPTMLGLATRQPIDMKRLIFTALKCEDAADDDKAVTQLKSKLVTLTTADTAQLHALVGVWTKHGTPTEQRKKARPLAEWLAGDDAARLANPDAYLRVFMTGAGEMRKAFVTKKVLAEMPDIDDFCLAQYDRSKPILQTINAIETAHHTHHLITLASDVWRHYDLLKQEAGAMDYDDLIDKTANLFADNGAAWVRYKLDQGIKYILLDESQDTSYRQWQLLSSLIEDQWDDQNAGKTNPPRSVFSVGDYKQSIYSFQGARPELFYAKARWIADGCRAHRQDFASLDLSMSFRSVQAILDIIDYTIGCRGEGGQLLGIGASKQHTSGRAMQNKNTGDGDAIGWVELAPLTTDDDSKTGEDVMHTHAQRMVKLVHGLIGKCYLPSRGRMAEAGDILLLHRARDDFYHTLHRQLQRSGLVLAAGDRVEVAKDIAGLDLLALADVVRLPSDDLQLAAVLKSPLFGLDDSQLYQLAAGRKSGESLWQRLAVHATQDKAIATAHATQDKAIAVAHATLTHYMQLAAQLGVHGFYSFVLDPATKQRFAQRLGESVLDVLAEFLECANRYEKENPPSLTGFADFMRNSDGEVKGDHGADSHSLRMLSVHGAKGLEAPIIILPDACRRRTPNKKLCVATDEANGVEIPLFAASPFASGVVAETIETAKDQNKTADGRENDRLLYVAMTRAEDGLYVSGFQKSHSRFIDESWYERIKSAMHRAGAGGTDDGGLRYGEWATPPKRPNEKPPAEIAVSTPAQIPEWVEAPPPPRPAVITRLAPSRFSDTLAVTHSESPPQAPPFFIVGKQEKKSHAARNRGILIHRLFERLPAKPDPATLATLIKQNNWLQDKSMPMTDADLSALIDEVLAVRALPRLAPLFSETSHAEVAISGRVGEYLVHGSIDRLAITGDAIIFVDFKTDQAPPRSADKIAPKYIEQIALYARLLGDMGGGKTIQAGLVYTATPQVFWLDSGQLNKTIARLLQEITSQKTKA